MLNSAEPKVVTEIHRSKEQDYRSFRVAKKLGEQCVKLNFRSARPIAFSEAADPTGKRTLELSALHCYSIPPPSPSMVH